MAMNLAVQKTLSLILLIFIGVLLKKKIKGKEQLAGIKEIILSLALPATIFVALLKVEVKSSMLLLPLFALVANFSLLAFSRYVLPFVYGKKWDDPDMRTLLLLLPSFAPGLSCFPFITEFLGEEGLAFAALADIGNKVFVLIFLYLLAMHWFYQFQKNNLNQVENRIKGLLSSMIKEPVNLVIFAAIIMLSLGWNMVNLPAFLQEGITKISFIMTPLVLLFIGLAVNVDWRSFLDLGAILLMRSGFSFLISALFIMLIPGLSKVFILFLVVFPQSACSFWPFAHISTVFSIEQKQGLSFNTFDTGLALNVLALSLPLSTAIILGVFSFPETFSSTPYLFGIGLGLLLFGAMGFLGRIFQGQPIHWFTVNEKG